MSSSSFKIISIMGMTLPVFKKSPLHVGFVTNACNLSTWKAEAGRAWFVQGQPGPCLKMKGWGGINSVVSNFLERTEMFVLGETSVLGVDVVEMEWKIIYLACVSL